MNPFEQLAITAKPVWQQRQEAAAEKRRATMKTKAPDVDTPVEKKLRAQMRLTARWRAEKRRRYKEMLQTEHRQDVVELKKILRKLALTPASATHLINYVAAKNRLLAAPPDILQDVLGLIAGAIARLRERAGYPPFDDAIFSEEPTAFDRIKQILEAATESSKHDRRTTQRIRRKPAPNIFA